MSLTPSPVVVDALNADALVVSAVPGGVWWGIADQSALHPFAVLVLVDGVNENVCQGSQVGTLDLTYAMLAYAPLKAVTADQLQDAATAVHNAILGLGLDAEFDGWVLRRRTWQRVIERPIPTDGEDRWQAVGGQYLLSFVPSGGESES
jgi:hypothetical protein